MPSKKPKLDTFRKVANACGGILSDIAANLGLIHKIIVIRKKTLSIIF